ncbi:MAG: ABC transporter permease [Dehalococcoidia bacterium]
MVEQDMELAGRAIAQGGRGSTSRAQWLQEVAALSRRWYLLLIRERLNLVFSIVQPAIWLVFFGSAVGRAIDEEVIGTSDYIGFMLAGIISFTIVGNGVSGAMPLLWDKETGYLDRLMSMPIARSSVIVSRFVFQVGLNSAQTLLVIVVALVMGVEIQSGVLGVIVILVAAGLLTMALTSLFIALAYYVPGHGTFFAITGFVTLPLLFMSNAFVPLSEMPGWMEIVARGNPMTYAIDAMRTLIIEGWEADVLISLGVLGVVAIACLLVGNDQFSRQTGERVAEPAGQ